MAVARKQVEDGAQIIDINVDDGMIDGIAAMTKFLRIAVTEPEVAKVCPRTCMCMRAQPLILLVSLF